MCKHNKLYAEPSLYTLILINKQNSQQYSISIIIVPSPSVVMNLSALIYHLSINAKHSNDSSSENTIVSYTVLSEQIKTLLHCRGKNYSYATVTADHPITLACIIDHVNHNITLTVFLFLPNHYMIPLTVVLAQSNVVQSIAQFHNSNHV